MPSVLKWIFLTFVGLFPLIVSYIVSKPVVLSEQGLNYFFKPGQSIQTLIDDLSKQKIIEHPTIFKWVIYLKGNNHKWRAGEYLFPKGTSYLGMVNQLVTGKGLIYHPFTIVAGWNFIQLRNALLKEMDLVHSIALLSEKQIMDKLGISYKNMEGLFFPETYFFMKESSDLALLKRSYQMMQNQLKALWESRDPDLPFSTIYQALIAASLVEKEAYLNQERPIIAGVMVNRLRKGMLLQFDPTVIYGLGNNYAGSIRKKDLIKNTSFNTYLNKGLPPSPIAIPSRESILAVLHPQKNDFFYFVAKGNGSHQFSKTLEEHNQAIQKIKLEIERHE